MSRIYSQRRNDPNIVVIADKLSPDQAKQAISIYARDWKGSKQGRSVKVIDGLELHLMFSDGKMAASMWIDPLPTPFGEKQLTAAVGPIPGLKV